MKFLQFFNIYDACLEQFYKLRPELAQAPFEIQVSTISEFGFGSGYAFAPYMKAQGYEPTFIIPNCMQSQFQWAKEHGVRVSNPATWQIEIAYHQVQFYKPDVLFITEPLTLDSKFLRILSHRPSVVSCWRAAPIPPGTDWSAFDLLLTNLAAMHDMAKRMGVKHTEHFWPGFEQRLFEKTKEITPSYDMIFCGQLSKNHTNRNEVIKNLGMVHDGGAAGFSLGLYLSGDLSLVPPPVAAKNLGSSYGIDYCKSVRSGGVCLDVRGTILEGKDPQSGQMVDLFKGETGTARMLEVTGLGRMLLAEHFDNLSRYFEIGSEIDTYRNFSELLEKARYYAANPEVRDAIARRGHARAVRDHSMEVRAAQFDEIIKRYLKRGTTKLVPERIAVDEKSVNAQLDQALGLLKAGDAEKALSVIQQAIASGVFVRDLRYIEGLCYLAQNRNSDALTSFREEVKRFPANAPARDLCVQIEQEL